MTKPAMRLTPFVGTGGGVPSSSHGGINKYIQRIYGQWTVFGE
jgi:hypothetical protein